MDIDDEFPKRRRPGSKEIIAGKRAARDMGDEGSIPRTLQEKANRVSLVHLFKAGLSTFDAAKIMGVSEALIRKEFDYDPEFHGKCLEAMEDPFEPVLLNAIRLSEHADVAGENEGAHKAMAQVMRFYDKVLDRKQRYELTSRALEAAAEATGPATPKGAVIGPAGVRELLRHIEKRGAIEATARTKEEE